MHCCIIIDFGADTPLSICAQTMDLTISTGVINLFIGYHFCDCICGLIPDLINSSKNYEGQSILFSLSIFGGIAFAFTMNAIHDILEDAQCQNCIGTDPCDLCKAKHQATQPNTTQTSDIESNIKHDIAKDKGLPCRVKVFMIALIIDFIVDGFIISFEGLVISIALIPHELVHALGDVVFLVNCGLGKTQSIIIRLLCQLTTPITGCMVRLGQDVWKDVLDTVHAYAHGAIAGMFIYILLIDIFPMIEEGHLESHQHHPYLGPKRTHSQSNEESCQDVQPRCSEITDLPKNTKISPKIALPFFFVLCFSMTGSLIYGQDNINKLLERFT
eukprot:424911_1